MILSYRFFFLVDVENFLNLIYFKSVLIFKVNNKTQSISIIDLKFFFIFKKSLLLILVVYEFFF